MRNPFNVMARLAKVVEGNGTSRKLDAPGGGSRDPIVFAAGMWGLAAADGSAWVSHGWPWVPLGLEKNLKKLEARLIARPISEHLESRFCPVWTFRVELTVLVLNLECLHKENLNEPNVAIFHVNEYSSDSALKRPSGDQVEF
ncbi:hypothetical protein CRG98_019518 [Punica granatum]|uniref:Uncharacterized protein n=1 Tax=Punica granatum TaxID=22663 RepID=A0A2I0JW51_PUNGR|nr:hypothetical protein CRG98_019518 [Punica granatum]